MASAIKLNTMSIVSIAAQITPKLASSMPSVDTN